MPNPCHRKLTFNLVVAIPNEIHMRNLPKRSFPLHWQKFAQQSARYANNEGSLPTKGQQQATQTDWYCILYKYFYMYWDEMLKYEPNNSYGILLAVSIC